MRPIDRLYEECVSADAFAGQAEFFSPCGEWDGVSIGTYEVMNLFALLAVQIPAHSLWDFRGEERKNPMWRGFSLAVVLALCVLVRK
jgi:hypothetical protein